MSEDIRNNKTGDQIVVTPRAKPEAVPQRVKVIVRRVCRVRTNFRMSNG